MKALQIMYGNSCHQARVMKANFSENIQCVTPVFPLTAKSDIFFWFRVSIWSLIYENEAKCKQ